MLIYTYTDMNQRVIINTEHVVYILEQDNTLAIYTTSQSWIYLKKVTKDMMKQIENAMENGTKILRLEE